MSEEPADSPATFRRHHLLVLIPLAALLGAPYIEKFRGVKALAIDAAGNVYAADLEVLLLRHPDVIDAAVIGVPSEQWGESPLGLCVLRAGASASPEELMDWCKSRIAAYKRPRSVDFADVLPRITPLR